MPQNVDADIIPNNISDQSGFVLSLFNYFYGMDSRYIYDLMLFPAE